MSNICVHIGKRIKELRKEKEWSQEQLAKQMGTTSNTISRWETGAYKPSVDDLEKMAGFFGIPVVDFFPQPRPSDSTVALMNATYGLDQRDIEEIIRFAHFRSSLRMAESS
jgi:transcriptional regulator with XRE-family HTH domain